MRFIFMKFIKSPKKFLKLISLSLASLTVCAALFSCGSNPAERKKGDGDAVMTVGEYTVPRDLYNYFVNGYRRQYLGGGKTENEEDERLLGEKIESDAEKSLSMIYAVFSLAADYGISSDSDEIKDAAESEKEAYIAESFNGDTDAFYKELLENYMTVDVFDTLMLHRSLQNALYEKLIESGEIDSDKDSVLEKLKSAEAVRVKHVLIKYDSSLFSYHDILSPSAPAKTAALEKAKEVVKKAKEGEDFDSLISEYGEDVMMFSNPDGYYIVRGNQETDFENACFSLGIGEISEPILTSEGASVIKRLEIEDEYLENNLDSIVTSYTEGRFNILVEERAATLTVEKIAD